MGPSQSDDISEPQQARAPAPSDPDLYRKVLHYLPTPVVVVDSSGSIVYANQALLTLGGWDTDITTDVDLLAYVHPEDRDAVAQTIREIVASPGARILGTGRSWAEVHFRLLKADGSSLAVELVGNGGVMDPAVAGIIYEVRPATTRDLLGRVLHGLSRGDSMHQLLSLVGELIASSPIDMDAAIYQSEPNGSFVLASSTSPQLTSALGWDIADLSCEPRQNGPFPLDRSHMPAALHTRLTAAGFQDVWCTSVDSPLTETTLRIIAASPRRQVPANAPKNRLARASELAAAVLLRTQADVLLEYAADRDPLTDLPNRAAFHQLAESLDPTVGRAAVHLDIDGLKNVNADLGTACSDAILQVVADRLRAACSSSDIVARLGDDEFTILLACQRTEDTVEILADRSTELATKLLDAVREPVIVGGRSLNVSASVGVALASPNISTDHLLTWADAAMHDAKALGGGRICRFGLSFG